MTRLPFLAVFLILTPTAFSDDYGTLIFEDQFERNESQELKDEPGNEWTTSSEKTAKGHKEVDLRDGTMYIYTHAEANHATSVRHAFEFKDGTIGLRFKLPAKTDSLILNFADLSLKSVHAGHLFKVIVSPTKVTITDQKTGEMNHEIRKAKKSSGLTTEQKTLLKTKYKTFKHELPTDQWHQIHVTAKGDVLTCEINNKLVGSHQSEGFAHETKKLLRLLVPKNAYVDDVKIWRKN